MLWEESQVREGCWGVESGEDEQSNEESGEERTGAVTGPME